MTNLRSRFILSHLLPILLVVPLVTIILLYLLETQILIAEMSEDITEKANLIAETVNGRPELLQNTAQAESFVAGVSIYIDEGVLLISAQGEILASTETASGEPVEEGIDLSGLDKAVSGDHSLLITYGITNQQAIVLVPVRDINQQLIGVVGVSDNLAGAASQIGRLRSLVLAGLLLELLLGIVIGIFMARRMSKPILRTAAAVIDIADGHQIDPVPIEGPDEIRDLAQAVNTLSERLRLLEETRRRSLANIVHELARPLGAIRSAVYVLRHGADDDPQLRDELLSGVEASIENMQPLLDDLSLLHGQVIGNIQLNRRSVSISEWLPPLLLPWRAVAQENDLQWQTDIPPILPSLEIDPDRMGQAVGNLIGNAVKYTPHGGSVSVTAAVTTPRVGGEELLIRIEDNGPGIQPNEQERIFEPFYRSQEQRRFPMGLGLGLTIARDLVEAHDGRLQLDSTPGSGSRFTIYLPLANKNPDHHSTGA
jgi:two-component system sensor histidine kinase BaeS